MRKALTPVLGFSRETVPLGDIYGGREGSREWLYCNESAHTVEADKVPRSAAAKKLQTQQGSKLQLAIRYAQRLRGEPVCEAAVKRGLTVTTDQSA